MRLVPGLAIPLKSGTQYSDRDGHQCPRTCDHDYISGNTVSSALTEGNAQPLPSRLLLVSLRR